MGLKENQTWPSEEYKDVAKSLALCNPLVTNRDTLTSIVQRVLSISKEKIYSITLEEFELIEEVI